MAWYAAWLWASSDPMLSNRRMRFYDGRSWATLRRSLRSSSPRLARIRRSTSSSPSSCTSAVCKCGLVSYGADNAENREDYIGIPSCAEPMLIPLCHRHFAVVSATVRQIVLREGRHRGEVLVLSVRALSRPSLPRASRTHRRRAPSTFVILSPGHGTP